MLCTLKFERCTQLRNPNVELKSLKELGFCVPKNIIVAKKLADSEV